VRREARDAIISIAVFILGMLIIVISNGAIVVLYSQAFKVDLIQATIETTKIVLIVNELVFLSLTILFVTKVFKMKVTDLGLSSAKLPSNIVLGLILGVAGYAAATVFVSILELFIPIKVPEWFLKALTATSPVDLLILLALTWVLVGPCEEIFFRGFVQGSFTRWKGSTVGIVVGALVFGFAHYNPQLWYRTAGAVFLGLIYGVIYKWRKSLIPVVAAHALNDSIAFILAFLLAR
jgi:membrane protease YdiL (CAAX protease family)